MKKKRDNEKFFLAVLLCGLFFMPLGLFAQEKTTVTISKKGVTLKEVIADLKEQTTYDFFYDSGLSALNETFDIDVKDKEVQAVLDEILPPLGLEYAVQRNLIIIREKLTQSVDEPMTIKGKVSDVRGSTMPGVTVLVKGTTIGTSTNVDGRFELSLPRQDKVDLVFAAARQGGFGLFLYRHGEPGIDLHRSGGVGGGDEGRNYGNRGSSGDRLPDHRPAQEYERSDESKYG